MKWSWILGRQVQEGEGDAAGDVTESPNNGDNGLSGGRATTTSKDATQTGIAVDEGNRDKTGSESEDKKIINFDTSNLPTTDRVFRPIPGMSDTQIFKWEPANKSISVDKVIWRGRGAGDDDDGFTNIASSKSDDGEYPDDGPLIDVSRESAMLGFASFLDDKSPLAEYRTDEMVLRIEWSIKEDNIDSAGFSETGLFTVAGERDDVSGFEDMLQDIEDAVQDGVESIVKGIVGSNPTGAETLTRALPTNSAASTGTAIPTLDSDDGDSDSGGGSGGLSTGAIAGIAVAGAVVFLGLIGGLIFFFLRRRRRTRERGHYNNPDNSTTFMAVDKEVHHQVTEAPHSTYSNDQQVPLSNLNGADDTSRDAGGPSGHHDHHHHHDDDDTEYVPYRDEDASPTSTGSGRAREDGAGTPHGVSRSVAHLVEEGMTEDEIRRLEDEERQLDDAIQRRGQR